MVASAVVLLCPAAPAPQAAPECEDELSPALLGRVMIAKMMLLAISTFKHTQVPMKMSLALKRLAVMCSFGI